MKIICIGGGPAGLYFAISMKLRDPSHDITILERNRPDDTFGWGVVLSDQTLGNLRNTDPVSAATIGENFYHWDDVETHFRGQIERSGGHGFCGIGRMKLLNILQARAAELGVDIRYEAEVDGTETFADADLVIAGDGVNSRIRNAHAEHFRPDIDVRANKYMWLGTHQKFDAFTFIFEQTDAGWIWIHAYQFDQETSTFIVECGEETWRGLGFDKLDTDETITKLEEIFAGWLGGHKLMSNARHLRGSAWLNFNRVSCETWRHKNIILMGDAAHTAHFSIGSGTKLALEDAIDLSARLHEGKPLDQALADYEDARRTEVLRLQSAARNSTEWFEHVERYVGQSPEQFNYGLLTRSQRISHEELRLRDPDWLARLEDWFLTNAGGRRTDSSTPTPPMFAPYRLRGMTLTNRVVVSPMSMYSATDGLVDDFHLVHYGSRAQGGAGLVITEMTDVSAEGRITPGCAGLYSEAHVTAWKRITDYVHRHSSARIALQLGHAGPKGSTRIGWEGMDQPLPQGENWDLLAPSAQPWSAGNATPREMDRADMDRVRGQFVAAARRADTAGFDMLELHCAHGYLLSAFITPLTNHRRDEYGGSLENRLRFPLEIFTAIRNVWPEDKPVSVRLSAHDWVEQDGLKPDDAVIIAGLLREAGCDIIDVSSGQTSPDAKPVYGRMFQTPFADRIRNETGIATMAVGNIFEADHVNSILAAGRADLCCLARPHLADPNWTLRAAAQQGFRGIDWPKPYLSGRDQMERNLQKQMEAGFRI